MRFIHRMGSARYLDSLSRIWSDMARRQQSHTRKPWQRIVNRSVHISKPQVNDIHGQLFAVCGKAKTYKNIEGYI